MQRTTAHLRRDFAHRVAVYLERTDGGVVHVGEEALHDATPKEEDGGGCGGWGRFVEVGGGTSTHLHRPPPASTNLRFRRREHPHGEPKPSPARQPAGYARRPHKPRDGVHDA